MTPSARPPGDQPSAAAQVVLALVVAGLVWLVVGGLWFVAIPACGQEPTGWTVAVTKVAAALLAVGYVVVVRRGFRALRRTPTASRASLVTAFVLMAPAWAYAAAYWPTAASGPCL